MALGVLKAKKQDFSFDIFAAPPFTIYRTTDSNALTENDQWLATKTRAENLAERYAAGETLFIQTARLRGPFNSKWRNPWIVQEGILESRERDSPRIRADRLRRRQKEHEERRARARALQADGLGKSPAQPVDLTEEDHQGVQSKKRRLLDTNIAQPSFDPPRIKPTTDTNNRFPVSSAFTGHAEFRTANDDAREVSRQPSVATHARQPELAKNERPASSAVMDAELHRHTLDAADTTDVGNRLRSDDDKRPYSLPTPSQSGDEDDVQTVGILVLDQEMHDLGLPAAAHGRSLGFTAVNAGSGKHQLYSAENPPIELTGQELHGMDTENSTPNDSTMVSQEGKTSTVTDKVTLIEHVLANSVAAAGPHRQQCRQCATRATNKWYSSGTLCQRCYGANRNIQQRQEEVQFVDTTLSRSSRTARKSAQFSHFTAQDELYTSSQPDRLVPEDFTLEELPAPAASFPQHTPQTRYGNHNKIIKQMFPGGLIQQADAKDRQLRSLMGASFKPHWHSSLRKKPEKQSPIAASTAADEPLNESEKVVATRKSKKRMMSFDTPVVRREFRRRKAKTTENNTEPAPPADAVVDVIVMDTEIAIEEPQTLAPDRESHAPEAASVLDVEEIISEVPADIVTLGEIEDTRACEPIENTLHQSTNVVIVEHPPPNGPTLASLTAGVALPQNTPLKHPTTIMLSGQDETPRSHCRKLFAQHTNSLLSAAESSRLRSVARLSGGHFLSTPVDSSPSTSFNSHSVPIFQSTQAEILKAQAAFQEALESPIGNSSQADAPNSSAFTDRTLLCNITPFRNINLPMSSQIRDESQEQNLVISTQALFDAFTALDSPSASQKWEKKATFASVSVDEDIVTPKSIMRSSTSTKSRSAGKSRSSLKKRGQGTLAGSRSQKMDAVVMEASRFLDLGDDI